MLILLVAYAVPYLLNAIFMVQVVERLISDGAWIPNGEFWMQRALLYMLPYVENFPARFNQRGFAILEGIYGSADTAEAAFAAAAAGAGGWSVQEWFMAFARYPIDFLCLILDKAFMCVTTDAGAGDLYYLLSGYTMLYIAILTMVKHTPKVKNVFQGKSLLVIAALLTIAPSVVLTVEARYTISLQSLIFGVALMGPILGDVGRSVCTTMRKLAKGELKLRLRDIPECVFPWELLVGIFFVWVCLTHYGDLMAHTYSGLDLLFTK